MSRRVSIFANATPPQTGWGTRAGIGDASAATAAADRALLEKVQTATSPYLQTQLSPYTDLNPGEITYSPYHDRETPFQSQVQISPFEDPPRSPFQDPPRPPFQDPPKPPFKDPAREPLQNPSGTPFQGRQPSVSRETRTTGMTSAPLYEQFNTSGKLQKQPHRRVSVSRGDTSREPVGQAR